MVCKMFNNLKFFKNFPYIKYHQYHHHIRIKFIFNKNNGVKIIESLYIASRKCTLTPRFKIFNPL